ncbi:MAG: spore maturation protein, partial [Ruminococcus sp.]|nr:spore maturation protein [Ruminococcus sp.]
MELIMPAFAAVIIIFGLIKRVPVFDCFLEGAKEGFLTLYRIAPTILGLVFAVGLLRSSGAIEVICTALSPVADAVGFPVEVVPMALLRPVSGGGSTALLISVFEDCGPDSFAGRVASVLAGSSETTFFAITMYFGSVGVKRIRHTAIAAVAADLTAMIMSAALVRL